MIKAEVLQRLTGLALTAGLVPKGVRTRAGGPVFSVRTLREARRQKDDGRPLNQVFITLLQREEVERDGQLHKIRCGSMIVIDLDEEQVTYVIRKGLNDQKRIDRTIAFRAGLADTAPLAATYFGEGNEPFAALHHAGA